MHSGNKNLGWRGAAALAGGSHAANAEGSASMPDGKDPDAFSLSVSYKNGCERLYRVPALTGGGVLVNFPVTRNNRETTL